MLQVALITNYNISYKLASAITVADKLHEFDCNILVPEDYRERIENSQKQHVAWEYVDLESIYKLSDMIIVLGGDGTIMESARRSAQRGTPILGINLGRVGYLSELEIDELHLLESVMNGKYFLDKRTMLNAAVIDRNGNERASSFALNDAVISNGSIARMVDLQLYEGGTLINTYHADGLIIATPTGSTAYSMSAGGPVADPRISCFCATPICPHLSSSRPILFPDDSVIEVKNVCKREKMLYLTLDGRVSFELMKNDVVRITKSDLTASIIRVKKRSFYDKLRQKTK